MGMPPIQAMPIFQSDKLTFCMHRLASRVLLLVLCIVVSTSSFALDPTRNITQTFQRIWQTQQGLPQATIFSICQTGKTYIWMGTPTGLIRFDGNRFKQITQFKGINLQDAWIRVVAEDSENNLWFSMDGIGAVRIKDAAATIFDVSQGLPSNNVQCMVADAKGGMWIGTDRGIARIEKGNVKAYQASQGLTHERVNSLALDKNGTLWIAGEQDEVGTFKDGQFSWTKLKTLTNSSIVTSIWCAGNGTIWFGTTDGLISWKKGVEKRFTTAEGLTNDWIYTVIGGRGGVVWVGTKDGFSRIRGDDDIQNFRSNQGLSHSTVYSMIEDHEGNLWVATKQGLNQFVERRTLPFTTDEGLPSNNIGPLCQDADGAIWIGTLDKGLTYYENRKFINLSTKDGLPDNSIVALVRGERDDLWVGTHNGLCCIRDRKVVQTISEKDGLSSNAIQCLLYGPDESLWIGTARGLDILQNGKVTHFVGDENFPFSSISAIVRYRGTIVVAIEGEGVFRCIDREFVALDESSTAYGMNVLSFFADEGGNLWMGTRGEGLLYFDGKRTVNLTVKQGLWDDDVFEIIQDSRQRLWMACSKGIFFAEKEDLIRLAKGQLKRISCLPFTPTDLLRTIECQALASPAALIAKDGRIWFATIRGIIVVDPNRIQRAVPPPRVVVEDVIVNGMTERPDDVVSLGPGQSNLTFRYTALSFTAPPRIEFRYILEGFDKDWIDAGTRREAYYTNLPPGQYKFRVSASYVDGPTGDVQSPIAFEIRPYFYQTTWFMVLCAASVAAAGWLIYRARINRIEDRMHLVLSERTRIARELHDTLMQGFSGITLEMQALANRLPSSKEQKALKEIIRDAGQCMTEARRSLVGLRSRQAKDRGLGPAIEQSARQMAESRGLRLKMKVHNSPKDLPREVEYNLLRIAQEAVANAVRHSSGKTVEVALGADADDFVLSVSDDGVGIDSGGNSLRLGHYGIIGMQERATQIGAKFQLDSKPGEGTTIRVVLPRAMKE
jgi:ligand-binding sensor domain-containing protein/signal transduction histidine kinase